MKIIFTIIADTADTDLEQYNNLIKYCESQNFEIIVNKFRLPSIYFYSGIEDNNFVINKARNFFLENTLDINCDLHLICLVYQTLSLQLVYLTDTTQLIKNSKKTIFYIQNDSQVYLPHLVPTIQNVKLLSSDLVIQTPYGTRPWFDQFVTTETIKEKLYDLTFIGSDSYVMQQGIPGEGHLKTLTRKDFLDKIEIIKGNINFNRLQKNYSVQDYINILQHSKISISLLGLGEHCYRLFECMKVGVCVIQQKFEYENLWADPTINGIVPTFSTPEELIELVNNLLKNNNYIEVQKAQAQWYQENYSDTMLQEWAKNTIDQLCNY